MQNIYKLLSLGIVVLLSGCSTYSNQFSCSDAKGAYCLSMEKVDRLIASGEIDRFNEDQHRHKSKTYLAQKGEENLSPKMNQDNKTNIFYPTKEVNGKGK